MKKTRLSFLVILFFTCLLLGTRYYLITWAGGVEDNRILQNTITWIYEDKSTQEPSQIIDIRPKQTKKLSVSSQKISKSNKNVKLTAMKRDKYMKTDLAINRATPLYGLSINADINLGTEGFVRVIAVGKENTIDKEYLVYEASSLLSNKNAFTITNACDETCALPDGFVAKKLEIQIKDTSSIKINSVNIVDKKEFMNDSLQQDPEGTMKQVKDSKISTRLERIKDMINKKNLKRNAGMTDIASMSYQEKKNLFMFGEVPDVPGFEYYVGGTYSLVGAETTGTIASGTTVKGFDRRTAHGKNLMTSIKNQGSCGSCRAFSAVGAVESIVNVYFNKNVNLNLSEQDILTNSKAGSCAGGYPSSALDYIKNYGVVDEQCYTYSAVDLPSYTKCSTPTNIVKIVGRTTLYTPTEFDLKKAVIDKGPLSLGILSWSHAVVLVGFETDVSNGTVTWIFKNSWGSTWGENGYGKIQTPLSDLYAYAIITPTTNNGSSDGVACEDNDADGYCNRGISPTKPSSCPASCKAEKDCNDADASAQVRDANYNCGTSTNPTITCLTTQHIENNICVDNTKSCTITNGIGTQTRNGSSRGTCTVTTCNDGYQLQNNACVAAITCLATQHIENSSCVANTRSCTITNGIGTQTRNGSSRGTCTVTTCNTGYKIKNNTCVINKTTTGKR